MPGADRIAIFPSRANFVSMKQRIASADKGLSLLKRKRDALDIHLKQLSAQLKKQREKMDPILQEAIFSMAKANFLRTDFKPASVVNPDRADAVLQIQNTKIVGMQVPTFELMLRHTNALNFTGLASGGQQVQIVRDKFQEALKVLVSVASLEYSVSVILEAVKQTNMRVNGLEYVVLPRYQNTLVYIRDELDELEREDFYRLKRSQAKQMKKKSDFIKFIREREREKDTPDLGTDFGDTHLQTSIHNVLSARPSAIMSGRRMSVAKVSHNTIVYSTDQKPLRLAESRVKLAKPKKEEKKEKKVVTSSSSSTDSQSSE